MSGSKGRDGIPSQSEQLTLPLWMGRIGILQIRSGTSRGVPFIGARRSPINGLASIHREGQG
jgi:hypothetical protein